MKKITIFACLFFFGLANLQAQKIITKKRLGAYCFFQNGEKLSTNDLMAMMESDDEMYQLMDAAQTNKIIAQILGIAGGGLIGWELGTLLVNGKTDWLLGGIGAGLIVIGIPFSSKYNKKSKQAVDLYNSQLSLNFYKPIKSQLQLRLAGNGAGLVFRF